MRACGDLRLTRVARTRIDQTRRGREMIQIIKSALTILATLIPWIGRYFSPERKLERLVLAEAKREAEAKLRAEKLRREHDTIERDNKSGTDLLDSLNRK